MLSEHKWTKIFCITQHNLILLFVETAEKFHEETGVGINF